MAMVINPISPVAFSVFGLPVRWYALSYIIGFILGFYLFKHLVKRSDSQISLNKNQMDDFLTAIVIGVILGGRLGYVLFYNFGYFLMHPVEILTLWHGGMSFHGGFLGAIIAVIIFVRRKKISDTSKVKNTFRLLDLLAVVAPIGLFCGRIANFINMEVMGRPTNSPLGIVFKGGPEYPRHPSPLYEAALEGIVLFILMLLLYNKTNLKKHPGAIGGLFCVFYAIFRIICEQFRQPDVQIGFLTHWGLTMGQLLSGGMFVCGFLILYFALKKRK